jgi:hypothetical protein
VVWVVSPQQFQTVLVVDLLLLVGVAASVAQVELRAAPPRLVVVEEQQGIPVMVEQAETAMRRLPLRAPHQLRRKEVVMVLAVAVAVVVEPVHQTPPVPVAVLEFLVRAQTDWVVQTQPPTDMEVLAAVVVEMQQSLPQ